MGWRRRQTQVSGKIINHAAHDDVITHAVRHLLDRFQPALPNLHSVAFFLPNSSACTSFRKILLEQLPESYNQAVIPPWAGTLNDWLNEFIQLPESSLTIISEQTRRIMLIEALQQYPALFKQENKWQVTLALLKLFDELNFHNASISDNADEWLDTAQRAYGIDQKHEHLEQEASLVHTLCQSNAQLFQQQDFHVNHQYPP